MLLPQRVGVVPPLERVEASWVVAFEPQEGLLGGLALPQSQVAFYHQLPSTHAGRKPADCFGPGLQTRFPGVIAGVRLRQSVPVPRHPRVHLYHALPIFDGHAILADGTQDIGDTRQRGLVGRLPLQDLLVRIRGLGDAALRQLSLGKILGRIQVVGIALSDLLEFRDRTLNIGRFVKLRMRRDRDQEGNRQLPVDGTAIVVGTGEAFDRKDVWWRGTLRRSGHP